MSFFSSAKINKFLIKINKIKNIFNNFIIFFLLLLLAFLCFSKDYLKASFAQNHTFYSPSEAFNLLFRKISFTQHYINVDINTDGSMNVEEWITYKFRGKYNGVFQNISYNKSSGISNLEVYKAVSNVHSPLTKLIPLENNSSQLPETFEYTDNKENKILNIKIYTPSKNTEKTYVYKYKINDVITKYNDVAELYWIFISKDNETPNKNVEIIINVPEGATKKDLRIFGHGPLRGTTEILDNNSVRLYVDHVKPCEFVEARLLFPSKLINNCSKTGQIDALNFILQEESNWAKEANQIRKHILSSVLSFVYSSFFDLDLIAKFFLFLLLVITLVSYTTRIFKRISQKLNINYDYYRELPGDYSPAITSLLMYYTIETKDISATILDLVRRRYLTISQHTDTIDKFIFKKEVIDYTISLNNENYVKNYNNLREHEKFIIDWFIKKLGNGQSADLRKIQEDIKSNGLTADIFKLDFSRWKKIIKTEAVQLGLFKESNILSHLQNNIILILIIALFLLSTTNYVFYALSTFIILWISPNPLERTYYGLDQYYKWKSFKKYLKNFSNLDKAEVPTVVIWEHYLVYAISLGVAEKVIKQLKLVIPIEDFNNVSLTFLGNNIGLASVDSFSLYESSFDAINSSVESSSSGGGGGFSGGGGGGGGGSSGGGF